MRQNKEFIAVARHGKVQHSKNFYIKAKNDKEDTLKIGFSIRKKVGNAVKRNRLRRRLRDITRREIQRFQDGINIVITPKNGAIELSFQELRDELLGLLSKSKLIKENQ